MSVFSCYVLIPICSYQSSDTSSSDFKCLHAFLYAFQTSHIYTSFLMGNILLSTAHLLYSTSSTLGQSFLQTWQQTSFNFIPNWYLPFLGTFQKTSKPWCYEAQNDSKSKVKITYNIKVAYKFWHLLDDAPLVMFRVATCSVLNSILYALLQMFCEICESSFLNIVL